MSGGGFNSEGGVFYHGLRGWARIGGGLFLTTKHTKYTKGAGSAVARRGYGGTRGGRDGER